MFKIVALIFGIVLGILLLGGSNAFKVEAEVEADVILEEWDSQDQVEEAEEE